MSWQEAKCTSESIHLSQSPWKKNIRILHTLSMQFRSRNSFTIWTAYDRVLCEGSECCSFMVAARDVLIRSCTLLAASSYCILPASSSPAKWYVHTHSYALHARSQVLPLLEAHFTCFGISLVFSLLLITSSSRSSSRWLFSPLNL